MAVPAEIPKQPADTAGERNGSHAGNVTEEIFLTKEGLKLSPQPVGDDALDPLNWSSVQKHIILAIIMSLYFMFTYITTTTVPSFPALQEKYTISLAQVNWTVAIPALGLSLGPLFWASPAETIGRRPVFILGTVISLASTIGAALAPTYREYMVARFFQGFGVSPASNVGFAIINDLFFEHERGQKVGWWVLAIDLGALCGPLIGGFVSLAGEQWCQWHSAIIFGVILALELAFLPETLYPRSYMVSSIHHVDGTVLGSEEKGSGTTSRSSCDLVLRTKSLAFVNVRPLSGIQHPKPWDTIIRFCKTFKFLVVPISVMAYCFGWYWWVISVITLLPVAYPNYSPQTQGLLYIGLILGTLFSEIFCSGRLSDWLVIKLAKQNNNVRKPEMRLWLAYPAVILTAIGLSVWGISVDRNYHWMVGQVALTLFGAGIQMGNTAVCAYIFDAYPLQSMATMVFYSVILNFSAFAEPFFIVPWVETVGFTWTFAGQALITVFLCIPILAGVHWYGGTLRRKAGDPSWVNPEYSKGN